jgi:hypothetical protein
MAVEGQVQDFPARSGVNPMEACTLPVWFTLAKIVKVEKKKKSI